MLAKCTNPSCFRPFLHLNEGRLFRLEIDPARKPSAKEATEYFWLCDDCSSELTLRLAPDGRVVVEDLEQALRDDPQGAFVSIDRMNGLFLRSVAFICGSHSKHVEGQKPSAA